MTNLGDGSLEWAMALWVFRCQLIVPVAAREEKQAPMSYCRKRGLAIWIL